MLVVFRMMQDVVDDSSSSSSSTSEDNKVEPPARRREGLQYEGGYIGADEDDGLFVRCIGWKSLPTAADEDVKGLWVIFQTKRGRFTGEPALDCLVEEQNLTRRGVRLFERALRRKGFVIVYCCLL